MLLPSSTATVPQRFYLDQPVYLRDAQHLQSPQFEQRLGTFEEKIENEIRLVEGDFLLELKCFKGKKRKKILR